MCGIVGVITRHSSFDVKLENAIKKLAHRGPDDRGMWSEPHINLAHTRLSILDLSPLGHQPMSYQNERYWITFNGEVYNYLELREELLSLGHQFVSKSDTEVLLAAYAEWGVSCLEKLRGMYGFGIWDRETKKLFIARDRTGEKPLYYWHDENGFYFASELKSLLTLLPETPKLDPVAIDLYVHYQYVPEPLTPLVGVVKLPAAHYLLLDLENWGNIEPQCYWNLEKIPPIEGDPVTLIRQELDRSIELTLRSDVPIAIALSGGLDSGAIAALAAPKYKDTLRAFSIGYPGRPEFDERDQAEQMAEYLGLPFESIELTVEDLVNFFPSLIAASDDPVADSAAYGHYSVMKLAASRGVKVMLTGIGGDELFWGYNRIVNATNLTEQKNQFWQSSPLNQKVWQTLGAFTDTPIAKKLNSPKVPGSIRTALKNLAEQHKYVYRDPQRAIFYDLWPGFANAMWYSDKLYTDATAAQIPAGNPYRLFEFDLASCEDIPVKITQLLFDTWLASNCLALGDRLSMICSVETRLPLLDYKLIETVIGLRKTQGDHNLGHKFWLKSVLKGIVPDEVLTRKKRGFTTPMDEWMKAIIIAYMDNLKNGYLVELKVLNRDFVVKLLEEAQKQSKHLFILYKLVLLETWYREVVVKKEEEVLVPA
ncbi:MAG TPA: asparagine synthase (glutamine-hydrolyzing) [Cyanobacteria bacterium UBA11371]|nr:asparagine synthase (glutamine-hydrolyzing) [Cyanobacteria bacterium UBA11371]HBE29848.1 asparagine synthase (glutamine-hydrolyzing) [Cyanobacteria bacterium UBA11368]